MILIIDEEFKRASAIKEYLEEIGYDVSLIEDVEEADKYVSSNHGSIDAIILDLIMPWGKLFTKDETEVGLITGYAFYKRLREYHKYSNPIIIHTALHRPELLNQLKKKVGTTVVHKEGDSPLKIVSNLEKAGIKASI